MKQNLGDNREDGVLHLGVDLINGGPAPRLGARSFLFAQPPVVQRPGAFILRNAGPVFTSPTDAGGDGGDDGGGTGEGDGDGSADGSAF